MPILLKTSKQSSGRAPSISDNPTVDWQHPVNEGLYTWWPMVNGIWHDLTGTFRDRYPMEQMGAGAKITFDGNVYWNYSQAASSVVIHNPKGYHPNTGGFDVREPFTFMYAYKTASVGNSFYPFRLQWDGGAAMRIFSSYHTRPAMRLDRNWSAVNSITASMTDNFGRATYNVNDRIVNFLGRVDGGASGSANGTVYKDHSPSKTYTNLRRPDHATSNSERIGFDGDGATGTKNPRAHLGMRLWQGELNESAIDTLLNDRWAGMWWKTKTIFLPAATTPSTSVPVYLYHNRHRNRAA